jgi:hypothetical protein
MDEEEFESKQENVNNTLRDIFDEFIEDEDENGGQKKEVSEELKQQGDWVLRQIERLLSMRKAIFFDNGYPYNRRFHRGEFWQYAKEQFSDSELERGDNYNEVLDYLVEEEYLLFNERGSETMFDVFQAVLV